MQRATVVRQAGSWVVTEKRDRITLGYEDRYRRERYYDDRRDDDERAYWAARDNWSMYYYARDEVRA